MTITLAASATLQGSAGAGASITATVCGDEVTGGVDQFMVLYQGQLSAVAGVLYTTPGGSTTIVKSIFLVNTTAGTVVSTLFVNGTADANRIHRVSIPANSSAVYSSDGWQLLDASGIPLVTSTTTLTGDVTGSGTGTVPTTLATVNSNVGTFGNASNTSSVTVNAKGLTTAASSVPIAITSAAVTDFVEAVQDAVGAALTDTATVDFTYNDGANTISAVVPANSVTITSANVTDFTEAVQDAAYGAFADTATIDITYNDGTNTTTADVVAGSISTSQLATVNANVGSFGTATQVSAVTVDAKGRITAAANTAIQIAEAQVTNLVTDLAGKQPTGNYITALTADVTAAGPGSAAATLATVNANVGSFGSATAVPTFTVNAKGLMTAAGTTSIQIAESQVTNLVSDLAGKQPTGNYITALTADVTAAGPGSAAATLATVNSNVGGFGTASSVGQFTVNAKGLTTAAANVPIAIANTAVSGLGTLSTQNGTFSGTHSGTSSGTNSGDQNLFASVTGNTGTATADTTTDSIAITGTGSVSTAATDTPDGLVISNALATTSAAGNMSALDKGKVDNLLFLQVQSISTTNLALSGEQTIDGLLTAVSRVLLTGQTNPVENGLWVTGAGAWSRPVDFPTGLVTPLLARTIWVMGQRGLTNGQGFTTFWALDTASVTVGTTSQSWLNRGKLVPTGGATGEFLKKTSAADGDFAWGVGGGNAFGIVTGNSGTANADATADTIAITGTGPISTTATDTPDGLVISAAAATATAAGTLSAAGFKKLSGFYDAAADFGFVGDLRQTDDGATTGATGIITSATMAFTSADIGKRITLTKAGASASAIYAGTISSLNSGTSVNVSPNTGTTVAATGHLRVGTDNTTAITLMQTTINNATYPGAIVNFGNSATNSWGFPIPVDFTKPCIIQGIGRGYNADQGNYVTDVGGTRLAWWGTTSDGGTAFKPWFGWRPTGAINIKGGGFRDCWLDCRNGDQAQALFAVKLASVNGFSIREFFVMDALASGFVFDIDATPTEQESTARGVASNVGIRQLDQTTPAPMTTPILMSSAVALTTTPQSLSVAANTLPASGYMWTATTVGRPVLVNYTSGGGTTTLGGCTCSAEDAVLAPTTVNGGNVVQATPGNGAAAFLSGNATANTNLSIFQMWQISHGTTWGPAAIEFLNADSMLCDQVVINGGNATNDGLINRIRKPGVRFNGNVTSLALAARNNVFREGDAGAGGVSNMSKFSNGTVLFAPAGPNYWWGYQLGNGAAAPNIESGGLFEWTANGGVTSGLRNIAQASQTFTASTLTQVNGSVMLLPPQAFQIGSTFRWRYHVNQTTGAAVANTHNIRIGTLGTTADAIVQAFTRTSTAVADNGFIEVVYTITAIGGSATGTGTLSVANSATAVTGLINSGATIIGTPTAFNSLVSGFLYISLSQTNGAAVVMTTGLCTAEIVRIGNQGA